MPAVLSISIQPKQNVRFCGVGDLRGNNRAVITGREQQQRQPTYPMIRLQLPPLNGDDRDHKGDFYVLCSLHSFNANGGPPPLSPHLLMPNTHRELNYNYVFSQMDWNPAANREMIFQLTDYGIVRLAPEQYQQSLREKMLQFQNLQLPLDFNQFMGNLNMEDFGRVEQSGVLNVCLGFTIFERDVYTQTYRLFSETIYSDNIFHGDNLRIVQLNDIKGNILGGTEVTLIMNHIPDFDVNIHMFMNSINSNQIIWERIIPATRYAVEENALTFILPPGPAQIGEEDVDEIPVKLEVVVGQSSYKSECATFVYMNYVIDLFENRLIQKRQF